MAAGCKGGPVSDIMHIWATYMKYEFSLQSGLDPPPQREEVLLVVLAQPFGHQVWRGHSVELQAVHLSCYGLD